MSHQEIHDVRRSSKCSVCLENNIYVTSEDTIYCTPHQEMQKVCHIRIYRINALSVNAIYVWRTIYTLLQERKYNVHHTTKWKKQATSGKTGCAPYQEISIHPSYQETQCIVRYIRKYKKYATSGYTVSKLYQKTLSVSDEKYKRHSRRYNILYATSGNRKSTPHQEIQDVRHIRKCYV